MHKGFTIFAATCLVLVTAVAAQAGTVTLEETTGGNFNGYLTLDPDVSLATFDFSSDLAALNPNLTLYDIIDVSIRFSMWDGNSGAGEFDYGDLVLYLDGEDTGIELNGFGGGTYATATNSGAPSNSNAILSALLSDGKLEAVLVDLDTAFADDNTVGLFKSSPVTLTITAVAHTPLPAAAPLGLMLMGGLGLVAWTRRRKHQQA